MGGSCYPPVYGVTSVLSISIRVTNDKDRLMSAGQVILHTWLFSISSEEDALWKTLTGHEKIFALTWCPVPWAYPHSSSLDILVPDFLVFFSFMAMFNTTKPQPYNSGTLPFPHRINHQVHYLKFCPLKGFLFIAGF